MKKITFLFLVAGCLSLVSFAQSDKYASAMQKNLALFDSAKKAEDFNTMANNFERIGDAEKTQWLPYYYAALALSTAGWMPDVPDKDANAGRMNALLDKADAVTASNADKSEILSVRNMASVQQMMVDPQNRYMSYGTAAAASLQKAMELNPSNPRLYYLKGMSLFNTPPQFGGGKDKAKPVFQKADELFKQEKPAQFYPNWGQKLTEDMIAACDQK